MSSRAGTIGSYVPPSAGCSPAVSPYKETEMHQHATRTLLAAAAFFAVTSAAHAAAFTWKPESVKLAGTKFTADSFTLSDYARIILTPQNEKAMTFLDHGYMPIRSFSLHGQDVTAPGYGTSWGAYVDYTATGTQTLNQGLPTSATFSSLEYSIIGYNGLAKFKLDAGGNPTAEGTRNLVTLATGTLARGTLVPSGLEYKPESPGKLGIVGHAATTIESMLPQFSNDKFTGFDVTFEHSSDEYDLVLPTLNTEMEVRIAADRDSSTATISTKKGDKLEARMAAFAPAALVMAPVDVPEPGTALLVGAGALGLALLRHRRR